MNLSASKADTYFGCKRLFKYRYIKPPFPEPPKKAFLIGNIVHGALDMFHRRTMKPREQWPSIMGQCFKRSAERYISEEKTLILPKAELHNIKDMLQSYLDELRDSKSLPVILSLEEFFSVKIGGVTVRGKADRVDQLETGSIKVVDYKTSKRPATLDEVFDSVQLPTYAHWVQQEHGKDVSIYGEYIYLRHIGTKAGHQKFRISEDAMETATEKYKQIYIELNNGAKFPRNEEFKYCGKNCDFYDFCMKDKDD